MSKKKNTYVAKEAKKDNKPEKKSYVSPTNTKLGKILIWVLVIGMIIGSFALVIYMIINNLMLV